MLISMSNHSYAIYADCANDYCVMLEFDTSWHATPHAMMNSNNVCYFYLFEILIKLIINS